MAARYTEEQRREILTVADSMGTGYAVAEFGVQAGTIRKWRTRLGWIPSRERIDRLANGTAERLLDWQSRRLQLANEVGDLAVLAAKRVREGLEDATVRGLQDAATASVVLARTIDKAQLLTGAPTSRTEDMSARAEANELLERLVAQQQGPPA